MFANDPKRASGGVCQLNGPNVYFDQTATVVAMVVAIP
jgi:hypothetical protein